MTPQVRAGRRGRLPSLEAQTVAFFENARMYGSNASYPLKWHGFEAYLRYQPQFELPDREVVGEVLVIASVAVPQAYRQRGWFWRYCQLCAALARDGVAIESVNNSKLAAALRNRPEFLEFEARQFLLRKSAMDDWPLNLPPDPDMVF